MERHELTLIIMESWAREQATGAALTLDGAVALARSLGQHQGVVRRLDAAAEVAAAARPPLARMPWARIELVHAV